MTFQPHTFIYVYDALCGWCYGFSPTVVRLHEKYKSRVYFEVVSGGMITGDRIGPIGKIAPYIKQAYGAVEEMSGVKFGEKFINEVLEEGTMVLNSLKPSVALTAFKKIRPYDGVLFAQALQKAMYVEGKPLDDWDTYPPIATQFGLDADAFLKSMQHEETALKAVQEFQLSQQLQVRGFPTTFYFNGEKLYLLSRGFLAFEALDGALQDLSANAQLIQNPVATDRLFNN